MTAGDITTALFSRYSDGRHYIAMAEFRPGTGYGKNAERFIDFYVVDCYANHQATAFEIKVSRSDFLREIKAPEKRRLALHFSHEFFFVAPEGLIAADELPPECGLLEASDDGGVIRLVQRRVSLHRETARPTWRFSAAIGRAIMEQADRRVEEKRRALDHEMKQLRTDRGICVSALQDAERDLQTLKAALGEEQTQGLRLLYVSPLVRESR